MEAADKKFSDIEEMFLRTLEKFILFTESTRAVRIRLEINSIHFPLASKIFLLGIFTPREGEIGAISGTGD